MNTAIWYSADMDQNAQIDALIEMAQTMLQALENLKRDSASLPVAGHALAVPWLSQLGPAASYAPGDCGAACVAMLVNWRGGSVTVDDIGKALGKAPGYGSLHFSELIAAADKYNIHLRHDNAMVLSMLGDIDQGNPVIALLNYRSIPLYNRYDARYNAGHYVLVVGYTDDCLIYHDPYWPDRDRGAYKQMTQSDFSHAYSTVAPGNSAASHALRIV